MVGVGVSVRITFGVVYHSCGPDHHVKCDQVALRKHKPGGRPKRPCKLRYY